MIQLIYVSSATKEMTEEDLLYLLEQSRTRNLKQHVTGMLLYLNRNFIQVLEGDTQDVDDIYEDIIKDDRNTGNILMVKEEINERIFPDWSMGFKNLNMDNKEIIAGYTEFLNKEMTPNLIANKPNVIVNLLYSFKNNNA